SQLTRAIQARKTTAYDDYVLQGVRPPDVGFLGTANNERSPLLMHLDWDKAFGVPTRTGSRKAIKLLILHMLYLGAGEGVPSIPVPSRSAECQLGTGSAGAPVAVLGFGEMRPL